MDQKIPFICIVVGTVALAFSFLAEWAWLAVFVPILICGVPIVWGAIVGVVKEHDITADVLVSVAIVASVLIEEYDAAAEIAIIMQIGGFLEEATVNHANKSIMRLVGMKPTTARIVSGGDERIVPVEEVSLGDVVRILPGVSSLQQACARLGLPWHDVICLSLHGRDDLTPLHTAVHRQRPISLLTDARMTPDLPGWPG